MEYKLTEQGRAKCEEYIRELKAKRKEILDAKLDTANNTFVDFTVDEIFEDVIENSMCDEDGILSNGYGVTDHYDADTWLRLDLEKDYIVVE